MTSRYSYFVNSVQKVNFIFSFLFFSYEPQSTISALTRDQKLSTKKPFQTTTYKSVRITTTTLKKALQKKPNQKSTSKRPRKGKGFNTYVSTKSRFI